jgi:hypothetical protein
MSLMALSRSFFAAVFFVHVSLWGVAAPAETKSVRTPSDVEISARIELFLQSVNSPEKLSLALAALPIDAVSLRSIIREIDGKKMPRLDLHNGQIFADFKPTGIEFSSYSPATITYQGRAFSWDKAKTPLENFRALNGFLKSETHASFSWFTNTAYADEVVKTCRFPSPADRFQGSVGVGALAGMGVGIAGLLLFFVFCALAPVDIPGDFAALVLAGGAIASPFAGMGIGAVAGAIDARKVKAQQEAFNRVLNSDFQTFCDDKKIFVKGLETNPAGAVLGELGSFTIDKVKKTVRLTSGRVTRSVMECALPEETASVINKMLDCNGPEDAGKLKKELKASLVAAATKLEAACNDSVKGAPESGPADSKH